MTNDFYKWRDDVYLRELLANEQKMYEEQEFPSAEKTIEILKAQGEDAYVLGSVVDGEEGVILC